MFQFIRSLALGTVLLLYSANALAHGRHCRNSLNHRRTGVASFQYILREEYLALCRSADLNRSAKPLPIPRVLFQISNSELRQKISHELSVYSKAGALDLTTRRAIFDRIDTFQPTVIFYETDSIFASMIKARPLINADGTRVLLVAIRADLDKDYDADLVISRRNLERRNIARPILRSLKLLQ